MVDAQLAVRDGPVGRELLEAEHAVAAVAGMESNLEFLEGLKLEASLRMKSSSWQQAL